MFGFAPVKIALCVTVETIEERGLFLHLLGDFGMVFAQGSLEGHECRGAQLLRLRPALLLFPKPSVGVEGMAHLRRSKLRKHLTGLLKIAFGLGEAFDINVGFTEIQASDPDL